ncbi:MAG TPA: GNAT family N-acetyltransferase [Rhizomicrobium sp.]|nr:GNAT family N-acetyltransferase [Rhizomicrobium sp.]
MEITVSRSSELPDLAASWMELETRASCGFFLSWRWIGSWLRTTGAKPLLVQARDNGRVAALGLLVPSRRKRFFLTVNQICLHEAGLAGFDGVMIEHNNFLIARSAPAGLVADMLRALQAADPSWDEIVLGGVDPKTMAEAEAAGLTVVTDRSSPDFGVALPDPSLPGSWEDMLSSNQRAQLRRSRSFAERTGPLALKAAGSPSQALEFFEKMVVLHTAYWQGRGKPGAFATPFARAFHREIITSQECAGAAQLLELSAGPEVLGYLYNFQYGERVYSYQSGFSYSDDNRHRPGLLAHALAIEQARQGGMRVYDFLAGDAPYKARLGQKLGQLVWCRGQRNRPLLRGERAARALYGKLRGAGPA